MQTDAPGDARYTATASDTAVMLLHGFLQDADSMQPLADDIATVTGFTTSTPTLSGHGSSPGDLLGISWRDWYASVQDELDRLQDDHGDVMVVGHSLGGLLGLNAALDHEIDGLVMLAPSFRFRFETVPGLTTAVRKGLVHLPVLPWHNKLAELTHAYSRQEAPSGYQWFPASALRELLALRDHVTDRIDGPLQISSLVLQAADDLFADPAASKRYADRLGSALRVYRSGGHLLPLTEDRQEFVDDVTWFLLHC